jgi:osmotically-inducible protein OsmY
MLPDGRTAIAASGPASRNRDLEAAVASRLRQQGLGRENQIIILAPGYQERNDANRAPQGRTGSGRYEHRWAQSAQDRRQEQWIASQLQDTIPGGRDLYVLVQNGQAFLFGRVRNQQERERASEIAREIRGIERVRNQLTVAEQGWRRRDDSQIADAIGDALYWNPFVDAGQIEVDVNQGIATLSGTVDSFGGLIVAVESAFQGGARTIRSQLQIVGPADRSGTGDTTGRRLNTGLGRSQ